jgi:trans-aconitate methyltransferase
MTARPTEHWDLAYQQGEATRSWFEAEPVQSLRMIDAVASSPQSVIDVGGGSSRLADALIKRGWSDITVLDVSETALRTAQRRLAEALDKITWICHDLLTWAPERGYSLWHDRAVFHFFTQAAQREQYRRALTGATAVGSIAIIGCFAPDGPDKCSGLPVARYAPADIAEELGRNWLLVGEDREEHSTPSGGIQPFAWAALRRQR